MKHQIFMEGESPPALLLQRQIVQGSLLEHLSAVTVGRRECVPGTWRGCSRCMRRRLASSPGQAPLGEAVTEVNPEGHWEDSQEEKSDGGGQRGSGQDVLGRVRALEKRKNEWGRFNTCKYLSPYCNWVNPGEPKGLLHLPVFSLVSWLELWRMKNFHNDK